MSITITKNKLELEFHRLSRAQASFLNPGFSARRRLTFLGEGGSAITNSGCSFTVWEVFHSPMQRQFAQPCAWEVLTKYLLVRFALWATL